MVVPAVVAFAVMAVLALLQVPHPSPSEQPVAHAEPVLSSANAGELCLRLSENPREYVDGDALRRRWALRGEACTLAYVNQPENTQFKVAVARAMPYARKVEALALLREAAAQGNAEAYYELYEHFRPGTAATSTRRRW